VNTSGLYLGLYEQIREYAELVDEVLIALKKGTSLPSDTKRQQLGSVLVGLANSDTTDLVAHRVAIMLKSKASLDPAWLTVGQALTLPDADSSLIELLEGFAHSLEEEQKGAWAGMHGGLR
jgi:hypothetical protein